MMEMLLISTRYGLTAGICMSHSTASVLVQPEMMMEGIGGLERWLKCTVHIPSLPMLPIIHIISRPPKHALCTVAYRYGAS